MKKLFILSIIVISSALELSAQNTNDAGLWTTINIEKKINKKVEIFLAEEIRLKENFTSLNLFYTKLGIGIQPLKFLKIEIAYRFTEKYIIDNSFSYRHRWMGDLILKEKFGNFTIAYRQRIQSEVKDIYSSEVGGIPDWYSRNKFTLKYDLDKPIKPYIGVEFRYQISDPNSPESNGMFQRTRYIAGIDYKKNKKNTFGIYYLIQSEFNVSEGENNFIIGLEYSFSL